MIAFLAKPATTAVATETVGESMQRATRETDEIVMCEYGHVTKAAAAQSVVVVHQSYLRK